MTPRPNPMRVTRPELGKHPGTERSNREVDVKKLMLLAAGLAGYVLGTRAGRERYEQIKRQSSRVWHSSAVQAGVDEAETVAKQAADLAGEKVAEAASTVGAKVKDKVTHDDPPDPPIPPTPRVVDQ